MRIKKKNIKEVVKPDAVAKQVKDIVDAVGTELGSDEETAKKFVSSMVSENTHATVEFLEDKPGEERFRIGDTEWIYVWAKYPDGRRDVGVYRFGQDLVYDYEWFMDNVIPKPKHNVTEDELGAASRGIEYGQREPELGDPSGDYVDKTPSKGKKINYDEKPGDLPFESVSENKKGRRVLKTIKVSKFRK